MSTDRRVVQRISEDQQWNPTAFSDKAHGLQPSERDFREQAQVLAATEAAGEGIKLQPWPTVSCPIISI